MTKDRIAKKHRITKYDVVFLVMLAALTAFSIWKAPYGYINNDEPFYLTIPLRLVQGDALLINEWHVSQLSSLLLYPLVKLYMTVAQTTDGIVLCFRYIYVAVQFIAAVCMYLCLRKYGEKAKFGAIAAVCVFVPFTPYYIGALSYNSMGIMALILSGLCIATYNSKWYKLLIGGLLYASSVLCCPYLIVIYLLYSVVLLIDCLRYKIQGKNECVKSLAKAWGYFTLSAAIVALLLAVFVFRKGVELTSLTQALSEIMRDPEHKKQTILSKAKIYILHMFLSRKVALCSFGGCIAILAAIKLDKKYREHRAIYVFAAAMISIGYLLLTMLRYKYINFFSVPLNVLGIVAYFLADKRQKNIFRYVFVPGVLYSFLIHLGSNNNYYCITVGLEVANVASAYFIGYLASEMWNERNKRAENRVTAVVMLLAIVIASGCVLKERSERSFGDTNKSGIDLVSTLNEKVTFGVGKGLMMTKEQVDNYKETLDKTEVIRQAEGNNVLYFAWETWLYLADEKDNGAFSAWLSVGSPEIAADRLLKYWELNPDKQPDAIYIDKMYDETGNIAQMLNIADYELTETEDAYILQ